MKHVKRSRLVCAIGAALALMFWPARRSRFAQSTTDGAIGGLVADRPEAACRASQ